MPQKLLLDTDIGDDIDDAYALALVLASDELELLGVTTVFGHTAARARQAQTILKLAGRQGVSVAAGVPAPISPHSRLPHRVARNGLPDHLVPSPTQQYLDDHRPGQDPSSLPSDQLPGLDSRGGVRLMIDTALANPGLTVVTIGAQTNLAAALAIEPRIATRIGRLVAMAGCFDRQRAEWNIHCDPVAAALVARSGLDITYVGLDVTTKCVLSDSQLSRLLDCQRPIAANLAAATRLWRAQAKKNPMLHDPLAVATIVQPDLVTTRNGTVSVELAGRGTYGLTTFAPADPPDSGRHKICTDVAADAFLDLWLDRVLAL